MRVLWKASQSESWQKTEKILLRQLQKPMVEYPLERCESESKL
nr:MAG TPA: hypothetical protein [Caudoviricetes sp.]